jgi:alginate O-acetyltransferase complex protein AlgI
MTMLAAMAGFGGSAPTAYPPAWYLTPAVLVALACGIIGATPVIPAVNDWRLRAAAAAARRPSLSWDLAATAALFLVLLGAIAQSAAGTYNPFIYFRF